MNVAHTTRLEAMDTFFDPMEENFEHMERILTTFMERIGLQNSWDQDEDSDRAERVAQD